MVNKSLWLLVVLGLLAGCANSYIRSEQQQEVIHTIRLAYNNVHLVKSPEGNVLIDAGAPADVEELMGWLDTLNVQPGDLAAIVLTHGHYDHAGGAIAISERYGAPIVAGAGDIGLFNAGGEDVLCPRGFFAKRLLKSAMAGRYEPFTPTHLVTENTLLKQLIPQYQGSAQLVLVPGHTEGTMTVVYDRFAFVGDLFRGGIFQAKATEHFFMCDTEDNKQDITHFINEASPKALRYYTGHFGTVSRDSVERLLTTL